MIFSAYQAVRGFVGATDVLLPGEEFPHWVNFQTTECGSRYRVSLSRNMSEDDLLGLALFITLRFPEGPKHDPLIDQRSHAAFVMVGGSKLWSYLSDLGGGVHSWFVYIPRRQLFRNGTDFAANLNWCNFTLDFSKEGMKLERWGMRLLCKQEQDDHRIRVRKDEDDESDSSGSEYVSAIECDFNTDYESAVEYDCDTDYEYALPES